MDLNSQQIGEALGRAVPFTATATGYSVDTRTLEHGDLFVALRGPNHDGHHHVAAAFEKGASMAIVERPLPGNCIVVEDSLVALQRLAAWARNHWGGEVIGITGSAGKTTTKDAIAQMLSVRFRVGKTTGNFNNHVGVPLSLLRLPADCTHAVIEIGMNHAGEIRDLAAIARPRVGVVTNVGTAHIENFGSIEGIVAAKRELIEALPPGGIAVLNADDPRVSAFPFEGLRITYGLENPADLRGEFSPNRLRAAGVEFETAVDGKHNALNLLAGIATAGAFGIAPSELIQAVATFTPGKMRGTRYLKDGILILDDCYNANPDAVRAMLDVLRDSPAARRIAVLGEMLELGQWAEPLHRDVGCYVAQLGIPLLVGIRGVARQLVDAAIQCGLSKDAAFFFDTPEQAGDHLRSLARPGDAILFKGSRGTRVEKALQRFIG